jgi:PKD repeat protein
VYYWNNVISNASIGVQPLMTTSYSVYVVDANGCTSNTAIANVNVTPPLIVDVTASATSICPGQPVMLTVAVVQGGGPPYTIYNSNGVVLIPPITIYPPNSGLQWLYVHDGCGSVAHDSVYITVNPVPFVNFVSDTMAGCEPLTVAFTPMNPQAGEIYLWNFGDGSYNQLSYDMNPVHNFSQDGIFNITLTVTNSYGCSSTYVHNQMIRVYPAPDARFIAEPSSASIVKPLIHFINLSEYASTYIWSFGDGDSSSIENPWHWYPSLGEYMVQLIAVSDMGCPDTARSMIIIRDEYTFYAPTAISPDLDEVNDVFYVWGNGISVRDFHMYIYDRWGEIIFETDKYDPETPWKYGWDGRAKEHDVVPVGSYTWLVKYYDGDHIQHDKSGVVNVIR